MLETCVISGLDCGRKKYSLLVILAARLRDLFMRDTIIFPDDCDFFASPRVCFPPVLVAVSGGRTFFFFGILQIHPIPPARVAIGVRVQPCKTGISRGLRAG